MLMYCVKIWRNVYGIFFLFTGNIVSFYRLQSQPKTYESLVGKWREHAAHYVSLCVKEKSWQTGHTLFFFPFFSSFSRNIETHTLKLKTAPRPCFSNEGSCAAATHFPLQRSRPHLLAERDVQFDIRTYTPVSDLVLGLRNYANARHNPRLEKLGAWAGKYLTDSENRVASQSLYTRLYITVL